MEKNVVVTVFKVESEGYQALTELKQAAEGENHFVTAAALVKKEGNTTFVLDGFDTGANTLNDTAMGGAMGMLLGVLGGPVGMLLGAGYGALIGMNLDAADSAYGASMLEQIADKLDDGTVAIVALAAEETNDALDAMMSKLDTVIARFDADVVGEEVDEAYEMQKEMARQARMKLRKDKKDKAREQLKENMEILSANFTK